MIRYYRLFRSFKNWQLYLRYKMGLSVSWPLLFETRNGLLVEVPRRLLHTFKSIFLDESYMKGLEKNIPPQATIVDIGANAGYFTLFALMKFVRPSLFAYEPIPANYTQLERHRRLNPGQSMKCFPMAVSGHGGEIALSFDAADPFTTSATVFSSCAPAPDSLRVPSVTLQKIFEEHCLSRCDLLKIDCEGAEYDILYSSSSDVLKSIDQMAMEVHPGEGKDQNIGAMKAFLESQGFRIRQRPVGKLWAWRP